MSKLKSTKVKVLLAFSAIYIFWGGTYLANKYAIECIPSFFMAGLRFTIAGSILYFIELPKVQKKPSGIHWRNSFISGCFMLLIANGGIVWAQQRVPSGLTALLVSSTPIWFIILDWIRPHGKRPKGWIIGGIILGFIGLGLLISPEKFNSGNQVDYLGFCSLLAASIGWATGTMYSKHSERLESPFLTTAMHMICGGFLLLIAAVIAGDVNRFELSRITPGAIIALSYLIIPGSLIAFSAYLWLMHRLPPALVSTNSFVNPVIAVFIGWAFAGEIITIKMLIASFIIILAVIIISITNIKRKDTSMMDSQTVEPIEPV